MFFYAYYPIHFVWFKIAIVGMSAEAAAALFYIDQNLSRYGSMVLLLIGIISCVCNLLVFTQDTLRKNPCTIYLIAINTLNFVYICWAFTIRILTYGYGLDFTATNATFCRSVYYVSFVFTSCELSYLLLASIDRVIITSPNAATRQRSTRRVALVCLTFATVFWFIGHIHILFFVKILQFGPYYSVCYYPQGTYTTVMTFYAIGVNGVLTVSLMTLFGLWAVSNVRRLRRTNNATEQSTSGSGTTGTVTVIRPNMRQSKDHQLVRMVLVDILSYIICKCPVPIMVFYNVITQEQQKSAEQRAIEQSALQLCYFVYFINNCISCYTNMLVSQTFRMELKRVLLKIRVRFR